MISLLLRVPLVLESALSSSEIAARVEARLERVGMFQLGISGHATPECITLSVVNRFFSNSFQPYLYARFIPSASGTRLEGAFRLNSFARIVVFLELAFCFLAFCFFAGGLVQMPESGSVVAWSAAFFLFIGPCFFAGLAWLCFLLRRCDMERIRSFLMEVVA
jgi:hypothetical protein